jgi:invasion protein IalB
LSRSPCPATTVAQETDAPREPGEPYVADVFTDWELRCITAAEEGQAERCEMFQLLLDEQDNPVAVFRVSVPLVDVEDQVAAAVIVTPIETLLTPGIRVRIDDSEPVGVPYTLCEEPGCLARIPLTEENVEAFKAGGDVFLDIFALVRSDLGEIGGVPVALSASLRGFTAAYDALQESHAAFARTRGCGAGRNHRKRIKTRFQGPSFLRRAGASAGGAQHQHRVEPAEGEGVRQHGVDLRLPRLVRNHVERAFRVRFLVADGRCDHPVLQRHDAGQKLHRAGAADQVAVHGLRRRYHQRVGMGPKALATAAHSTLSLAAVPVPCALI